MLPVPKEFIKNLELEIEHFIWQNRRRRTKRSILYSSMEEGGIAQTDLNSHFSALKASWVSKLLKGQHQPWTEIARFHLNKYGDNFLVLKFQLSSVNQIPTMKKLPYFYQDMILALASIRNCTIESKDDLMNSIIWGNKYLSYNMRNEKNLVLFNIPCMTNLKVTKRL